MPGGRQNRQPEIIVTLTRVAPGSARELEALRAARRVWLDAQMDAMGRAVPPDGPGPGGGPAPVTYPGN